MIKKILAPLVGTKRDAKVLGSAFTIAKAFNAHVSALFVKPDPGRALLYYDPPAPPDVIKEAVEAILESSRNARRIAHMQLEKTAHSVSASFVSHPIETSGFSCSFRETTGQFPERVSSLAVFSDLVVFGPVGEDDSFELGEAFVDTLRVSGQPVLLTPTALTKMPTKIAFGWDGSAAAMRAIHASLPILSNAGSVDIIMVRRPGEHSDYLQSLKEYLIVHGITADEHVVNPGPLAVGDQLVKKATEINAELLVIGGYGKHGYWREAIFGGVTSHIRWHAQIPVLMVH